MNISQAAAQTGLSAKQIRDYEKQGLLPPAPRSEAGYRRFLPADLQRLRFIAHAREVGFSLAQIKRLLALADDPERHSRDVKQLASEHIAELNQKIATLQTMRDTLQAWHNQCAGDDAAACCILDGIGSLKKHWLPHVRSADELALMRAIKAQLDPLGLMNAGKVLA